MATNENGDILSVDNSNDGYKSLARNNRDIKRSSKCSQVKNIQDCDSTIVEQHEKETSDPHQSENNAQTYSRLKVRILLPIICALYFAKGPLKTVIFQYLLQRWSLEAGHNSSVSLGNVCDRNESDPAFKEADAIQSRVAGASVYYSWCSSGPSFLICLIIGAVVDLIGRKPGLILSQLGATAQVIMVVVIIRFDLNPDLFYVSYVLEGLGGSFIVFLVANLSTMADVSGDKKSRIGWIIIVLTVGRLFDSGADVGVGYVIRTAGYTYAGIAILVPVASGVFLTIFVLPETLPVKRRVVLKEIWTHNSQVVFLYVRDGSKEKRWSLFLSLMIFFSNTLTVLNSSSTDTLFQKHEPLCWDSVDIGYFGSIKGVIKVFGGLGFLFISRFIGCASDEMNSMASLIFLAGSYVFEAFVKTSWEMYLVPVIAVPSVNIDSITRGVMSYLAGPHKQGVLFSSIALIEAVCSLMSSTIYSNIYAATVDFMPGAVYFAMAGNALITFLLYIPFFHFYERPSKNYERL